MKNRIYCPFNMRKIKNFTITVVTHMKENAHPGGRDYGSFPPDQCDVDSN